MICVLLEDKVIQTNILGTSNKDLFLIYVDLLLCCRVPFKSFLHTQVLVLQDSDIAFLHLKKGVLNNGPELFEL